MCRMYNLGYTEKPQVSHRLTLRALRFMCVLDGRTFPESVSIFTSTCPNCSVHVMAKASSPSPFPVLMMFALCDLSAQPQTLKLKTLLIQEGP